jgi:hypothetical protein
MTVASLALLGALFIADPSTVPEPQSFDAHSQPITDPRERRVIALLHGTVHSDGAETTAVFALVDQGQQSATAMFTVFNCSTHTFRIERFGALQSSEDGERLVMVKERKAEGKALAMTPTAESDWGEAGEHAACGPST